MSGNGTPSVKFSRTKSVDDIELGHIHGYVQHEHDSHATQYHDPDGAHHDEDVSLTGSGKVNAITRSVSTATRGVLPSLSLEGAKNALKQSMPLHRQVFFPTSSGVDEATIKKSREKEQNLRRSLNKAPKATVSQILAELRTHEEGLTEAEVLERRAEFGPNAIPEKKRYPLLEFLFFMWNPLSWTMELAAIISIVLLDYIDFILIVVLLLINATIGFYEEHSASNAVDALKNSLTPSARVKRDGVWKVVESSQLVPGDIMSLKIGNVIPADAKLIEGEGVKIDQSSLTGESLPVNKKEGDEVYSGSTMKQGEAIGVVCNTGINTFFGKAANLVAQAESHSHLQIVLKKISLFCIGFIVTWSVIELIVEFGVRRSMCTGVAEGECSALNNVLVLLVGGIPIAMPTVLSVTMAIGATQLAKKQAIVSRLTAVEELAGMDILCSDKTGTLTLNILTVEHPHGFEGATEEDVMLHAALASSSGEDMDAIDKAVTNYYATNCDPAVIAKYTILKHFPFNPVDKKAQGLVRTASGEVFRVAKGAPQVILDQSSNKFSIQQEVEDMINDFAVRGFRALGVSRSTDPDGTQWIFEGLIPLFDPPRHDTEDTIKRALSMGVKVKMITGDQLAIAKETARSLGMGQNMFTIPTLKQNDMGISSSDLIESADGFAEMWPEHKYKVVKSLQKRKHIVGMTGDGVNDAPALKKADIGIAVHGATDAARSVSDIVLMSPGLSVIIDAIIASRKIFQRMRNYVVYSVAATVRICLTFAILTLAWEFYFPTIAIVIIAILNDGTMLTISKDRVKPRLTPDTWNLLEIFSLAFAFGIYLLISTIVLFVLVRDGKFHDVFGLPIINQNQMRGMIYLQVSISGLATIFVSRAQGFSYRERPGAMMAIAFVASQLVATFIGVYGFNGYPHNGRTDFEGCGWAYALAIWIWCIVWYIPMDFIKFFVNNLVSDKWHILAPVLSHRIHKTLHPHGGKKKAKLQAVGTQH